MGSSVAPKSFSSLGSPFGQSQPGIVSKVNPVAMVPQSAGAGVTPKDVQDVAGPQQTPQSPLGAGGLQQMRQQLNDMRQGRRMPFYGMMA